MAEEFESQRFTEEEVANLKKLVRVRRDPEAFYQFVAELKEKYENFDELYLQFMKKTPGFSLEIRSILPIEQKRHFDLQTLEGLDAELGKDFYFSENGSICMERDILELLKKGGYPTEEFEFFIKTDPVALLEKYLGVPFCSNLVSELAKEFATQDMKSSVRKFFVLCTGLTEANPQIEWENLILDGLEEKLGKEWIEHWNEAFKDLEIFFDYELPEDMNLWDDWFSFSKESSSWVNNFLARSLGFDRLYEPEEYRLAHQVWRTAGHSFLEIANVLSKHYRPRKTFQIFHPKKIKTRRFIKVKGV